MWKFQFENTDRMLGCMSQKMLEHVDSALTTCIEDEYHIVAMCDYFADLREAFTKELTKLEGTKLG
jgi:hypothetical protein